MMFQGFCCGITNTPWLRRQRVRFALLRVRQPVHREQAAVDRPREPVAEGRSPRPCARHKFLHTQRGQSKALAVPHLQTPPQSIRLMQDKNTAILQEQTPVFLRRFSTIAKEFEKFSHVG